MIPRQQDYRIEKYNKIVCLKDNKNEGAIGLTPLEFTCDFVLIFLQDYDFASTVSD
jgi:hypothetical protein